MSNEASGVCIVEGVIFDATTKRGIPFAAVVMKINGVNAGGATTDFNGKYRIDPPRGVPIHATLTATYTGYEPGHATVELRAGLVTQNFALVWRRD